MAYKSVLFLLQIPRNKVMISKNIQMDISSLSDLQFINA